jgi:hypothetical protein
MVSMLLAAFDCCIEWYCNLHQLNISCCSSCKHQFDARHGYREHLLSITDLVDDVAVWSRGSERERQVGAITEVQIDMLVALTINKEQRAAFHKQLPLFIRESTTS